MEAGLDLAWRSQTKQKGVLEIKQFPLKSMLTFLKKGLRIALMRHDLNLLCVKMLF